MNYCKNVNDPTRYICLHGYSLLFFPYTLAEPEIITENTQFVDINGHRLRIVHIIHELGSKVPLIVFIHGLGGQVRARAC